MNRTDISEAPKRRDGLRTSESIIRTVGLSKTYRSGLKEVQAVSEVSVSIGRGTFVVIVGPSGAGKSTLLHLLGGLDRPSFGTVLLDGADLYRLSERERCRVRNKKIGFIFQFYHLLPEFTALENVLLPSMIRNGLDHRDQRKKAAALLEKVGLGGRMDHRPPELSGGESQRVAIARSLMNDPAVLLCDEPTGSLDSKTGESIIELLIDANKNRGVSLVIVTHEAALREKAHEVLCIRDGRIGSS